MKAGTPRGKCAEEMTYPKIDTPTMIGLIMSVSSTASRRVSTKTRQAMRRKTPIKSAPNAPTEAPSVGENKRVALVRRQLARTCALGSQRQRARVLFVEALDKAAGRFGARVYSVTTACCAGIRLSQKSCDRPTYRTGRPSSTWI